MEKPPEELTALDPGAWLHRHGDVLFRYALQRVRDRDIAEVLVQETLLSALRGFAEFEGRSSERTWLVAILRRKIVDHFRDKPVVETQASAEYDCFAADAFRSHGRWRHAPSPWPRDAETILEKEEFWRAFDACFAGLSSPLADAFCLCEMEELATVDVCKVLGVSASNVWTRLHRARHLLRRCLEQTWFLKVDGES